MQGLKNLIARRRPSSLEPMMTDHAHDPKWPQDVPDVQADPEADEAPHPKAANFEQDRIAALAARDHVPRPARPEPHKYSELSDAPADHAPLSDIAMPVEPPTAPKQKIWDFEAPQPGPEETAQPAFPIPLDRPLSERPTSDRAKTRLLGFHGEAPEQDMFATKAAPSAPRDPQYPIGWIVVIDGPGRGASFTLTAGLSTVGRDPGQTVSLDFGDSSISREHHLAIAFDDEENRAFVGHGGKQNIVRLNDKPLLTTEELHDRSVLKIGKTVLQFIALCGPDFSWGVGDGPDHG